MSVNSVTLLGHLGQSPETKVLPSGNTVCNMSIATTEKWKDKTSGEAKSETQWHRVVVFGKVAENCGKYLSKGSQAYIEGKITTRSYEDDKGVKRYSTEIIAKNVQFIGSKSEDSNQSAPKQSEAQGIDASSIPF